MVQVAIDAGPLHGPRTGVGNSVAWTLEALVANAPDDVTLLPYVTSMRARLAPGERRLPIPAALAHRWWAHRRWPTMDRWLGRPDVVHGTNYVVPPTRVPRIVTVHDCWFVEHPDEAHPDVVRAGAALRRAIADGADVVTCSDATADRVRTLFDARSVIAIHHGPPPHDPGAARSTPALGDPDAPFVLALGTLERRKNIPTLVDAFGRLAAEHPTVQLRIAGRDGDDSLAVTAAIERMPERVRTRIVRHPTVGDPVKRWLLDRAAVLAYPSLDEGFGFPILEAQQAGVPVVASSAGSIPEIAGAGALLSLPLDAAALAAHLHWAITGDTKREELIARGHENVARFSWSRTAAELIGLYRRVGREA